MQNINISEEKIKILIVDDHPDNLVMLEAIIRSPQRTILKALSGVKAIEIIQTHTVALILLDVQMPEINGFETATRLRKLSQGKQIPIIFITAISRSEIHVFKGYESGAIDYLLKPIDPNILRHKVNIFVDLFQGKQALLEKSAQLEEAYRNQRRITEDLQQKTEQLHLAQAQLESANQNLVELNDQMKQDLTQARRTQLSMLPKKLPNLPNFSMAARYEARQLIGGDFYDVFELDDGRFGILLVDVTGHDTSAALVSFMVAGLFKTFAHENEFVVPTIEYVNKALLGHIPGGRFATVFYGIFDLDHLTFEYACLGHPEGFVISEKGQKSISLNTGGPPLGIFSNHQGQFTAEVVQLKPGDRVFLYTDGIVEMKAPDGVIFGKKKLLEYLKTQGHLPIDATLDSLCQHILDYGRKDRFHDDITLVCFEIGVSN